MVDYKWPIDIRAFSAERVFEMVTPGPVAQAFTFRAFGAESDLPDSLNRWSSSTFEAKPWFDTRLDLKHPPTAVGGISTKQDPGL